MYDDGYTDAPFGEEQSIVDAAERAYDEPAEYGGFDGDFDGPEDWE